jgi:predicted Holliday junction resolvase-like endonuclease
MDYVLYACLIFLGLACLKIYSLYLKEKDLRKKIFSDKKSTEVRTGHLAEKFAPFTTQFKHDADKSVFLGQPIDYIIFEENGITFSEIKSGKSQLSKKQKQIKYNVQNGNVYWEEIRFE